MPAGTALGLAVRPGNALNFQDRRGERALANRAGVPPRRPLNAFKRRATPHPMGELVLKAKKVLGLNSKKISKKDTALRLKIER